MKSIQNIFLLMQVSRMEWCKIFLTQHLQQDQKIPNSTNTLEQATRIVDEMMRFASYDDAKDVKHYVIASVTSCI